MLIECIPNVSEGRRPAVVAAMADAIRRVNGVRLLDCSSDAAHNRTVFTLVGDAARLERAVKREAARYGVRVLESEIVGSVPAAALTAAAKFNLQLEGFKPDQVLEHKLRRNG